MDQQQFDSIVKDTLDASKNVLMNKNGAYSPGADKLRAFKTAAGLRDVTTQEALGGMMVKHTTSLYDMIADAPDAHSLEAWDEKLLDHINYLVLLRAIVHETSWLENTEESVDDNTFILEFSSWQERASAQVALEELFAKNYSANEPTPMYDVYTVTGKPMYYPAVDTYKRFGWFGIPPIRLSSLRYDNSDPVYCLALPNRTDISEGNR